MNRPFPNVHSHLLRMLLLFIVAALPWAAFAQGRAFSVSNFSTTTPPEVQGGVVAVAGGYSHHLALKSDGTVFGWGATPYGDFPVPAGLSNVKAIAAGMYHSLALKSDGTVVAWGWTLYGQCDVPSGLTNVVKISAGTNNSMAIKGDGTVVVWGTNYAGQCDVPADLSSVMQVVEGPGNIVALKKDGTLVWWGSDYQAPPAGLSGVIKIDSSSNHVLALKKDGTVVGWGSNSWGPLDGLDEITNAIDIFAISAISIIRLKDGTFKVITTNYFAGFPPNIENVLQMCGLQEMVYLYPVEFPGTLAFTRQIGTSKGSITLPSPATRDWVFRLSTSNPLVSAPASVTIPSGQSSVEFPISVPRVSSTDSAKLIATADNGSSNDVKIILQPYSLVDFRMDNRVEGGKPVTINVTLDYVATADVAVTVYSSNPALDLGVGGSQVIVPAGNRRGKANFATTSVGTITHGNVEAVLGILSMSAPIAVTPGAGIASVALDRPDLFGNQRIKATVNLASPAGPGGATVNVSATNLTLSSSTVYIRQGQTSAYVFITADDVDTDTTGTVTATLGSSTESATATIAPNLVKAVSLSPSSVKGGTTTTATVRLSAKVNVDTVVDLSTDTAYATVPTTVTIPAGSSTATVTVNTVVVTKARTTRVLATRKGVTKQANLKITL